MESQPPPLHVGLAALSMPAAATDSDKVTIAVLKWMFLGILAIISFAALVQVARAVRRRRRCRQSQMVTKRMSVAEDAKDGPRALYLPGNLALRDRSWDSTSSRTAVSEKDFSQSSLGSLNLPMPPRIRAGTRERDSALCRAICEYSFPGQGVPPITVSRSLISL